jgi:hypothetical protein
VELHPWPGTWSSVCECVCVSAVTWHSYLLGNSWQRSWICSFSRVYGMTWAEEPVSCSWSRGEVCPLRSVSDLWLASLHVSTVPPSTCRPTRTSKKHNSVHNIEHVNINLSIKRSPESSQPCSVIHRILHAMSYEEDSTTWLTDNAQALFIISNCISWISIPVTLRFNLREVDLKRIAIVTTRH